MRKVKSSPMICGMDRQLSVQIMQERITYNVERKTLAINLEGIRIKNVEDIETIVFVVETVCKKAEEQYNKLLFNSKREFIKDQGTDSLQYKLEYGTNESSSIMKINDHVSNVVNKHAVNTVELVDSDLEKNSGISLGEMMGVVQGSAPNSEIFGSMNDVNKLESNAFNDMDRYFNMNLDDGNDYDGRHVACSIKFDCYINYDDVKIEENIINQYSAACQYLTKRHYRSVTRYTSHNFYQELKKFGKQVGQKVKQTTFIADKYLTDDILGHGTFGTVVRAIEKKTGDIVAVKILDKDLMKKMNTVEYIKKEIDIMKLVKHKHIIQLIEHIETDTHIYLVMEYAEKRGFGLSDIDGHEPIPEDRARILFSQLIDAIEYLHNVHHIVHRDLQEENICLDHNGCVKLIDFNCADFYIPDKPSHDLFCGNSLYVPPEVLMRRQYIGPEYDIWSLGVLLFKMVTGFLPFQSSQKVILGQFAFDIEFENISNDCKDLIKKILVLDPTKRITINLMKKHQWIASHPTTKTNNKN